MSATARPALADGAPDDSDPSRTPRLYRGALIGLGGIARGSHLPGLTRDPLVRSRLQIVATVDGDRETVPVDGVPHFATRDALREVGPIEFVDICTPTASHLELTMWAIEQGYHVLCEKPVALSRAEAHRIADAARANARVVMPCHQHRY
ncbi:MAG: Gfo/Idh/MocA family protein, partial [Gemmatimonadaceae bacterium]